MLLSIIYIIGITAEAMTGALAAGRRNMDWFGVMLVASCTAIGGGTVRDILLGHYPLAWVANPHYLIIVCFAGIVTTVMASWVVRHHSLFVYLDSLGLIAFSIIGCNVGIEMDLPLDLRCFRCGHRCIWWTVKRFILSPTTHGFTQRALCLRCFFIGMVILGIAGIRQSYRGE